MPVNPNNTANVAAGKPKIGGAVFAAPIGTTVPTDATTALDAAFQNLGYVSEDGVTNAAELNTDVVKAWGGDEVLVTSNGRSDKFKYKLIEVLNVDVLKHVYGSSNVSGTLSDGIHVKVNSKDTEDVILVFEMVLRNAIKRIVLPCAHVTEVGDVEYGDEDAVGYETTVTCKPDSGGDTHHEYIKTATSSSSSSSSSSSQGGGN